MKPIQLSAHTRPISRVRINRDGDLCFSTSKDGKAMVWYTSNGERLGTYDGHNGAIFDFDVDFDSQYGLTAGADCAFGLWNVCTGKLYRLVYPKSPDRVTAVRWACGSSRFMVCTFGQRKSHILIYDFDPKTWCDTDIPAEDFTPAVSLPKPSDTWNGHTAKVSEALWGPVNKTVVTASEDGTIRRWNLETLDGDQFVHYNPSHKGTPITSMSYSKDRVFLIASGKDKTARIFETQTLTPLKVFTSDKPLNCAVIHPFLNLVMVVGGQDARDVTTTSHKSGKFEIEFFHTVFEEKIGEIRTGHFSPINYIAISEDGSHFVTGAEEGNLRLFKFDNDFKSKFESLEKSFVDMGMK
jgi:translation initiation factor 3 subunit I